MFPRFSRISNGTRPAEGDVLPCLHLGMPKTATTCMQTHLFGQHSQIEYLGKYAGEGNTRGHWPDDAMRAMVEQLSKTIRPRLKSGDHRKIAERVSQAIEEGRVPVWSREGQTGGTYKSKKSQARFFRKVFGPCKVIIYVRRPDRFLESMYWQDLKALNKRKKKRPAWASHLGDPPCYFDIETWLQAQQVHKGKGSVRNLLCADTADAYASQFGRDNVQLFLFEQFCEDSQTVIRNMCRFMGIDGEEGVRLLEGKRANDRWSVEQVERLKALANSPREALAFRESKRKDRWRLLGLDEENPVCDDTPKARQEIPHYWLQRISRFVCRDHKRLADNWGLPLEKYGYSLDASSPRDSSSRAA